MRLHSRLSALSDFVIRSLPRLPSLIVRYFRRYLYSLDPWSMGLLNSVAAALIAYKVLAILLHRPLPVWGLITASPCLFIFDFMTILALHRGLSKYKPIPWIICILLMVCSAAAASLYLEGSAELNWSRSVQVCSLAQS